MTDCQQKFLNLANTLALKGYGHTAPNPMVGAVLVYNGEIIGMGWHEQYGGPHAEVNCVRSVSNENLQFLPESEMYVSLEPCNHFGKTPPCSHFIVEHKIPKVIIGIQDSFEKVNGSGIQYLKEHGVKVICVNHPQSYEINRRFFISNKKKRPFITLKWAESIDGYIGTGTTERAIVSNSHTQRWVHYQRFGHQAILVGASTIICDNPSLDVRKLYEDDTLVKIIWDKEGILHEGLRIFQTEIPKIIFTSNPHLQNKFSHHPQVEIIYTEEENFLEFSLKILFQKNIHTVYIEGGKQVLETFIQNDVYDEIHRITTFSINDKMNIKAPTLPELLKIENRFTLGNNTITILRKRDEV